MNTVERYICVIAIIYATCYPPTYFMKTQDTSVDSTSLVTLEVARNQRNFLCARSWLAILLVSLIFIYSRRWQTKRTLLTSMLCSSVVKEFFVPKCGTEIDEGVLCQNMLKTRFRKICLIDALPQLYIYIYIYIMTVVANCIPRKFCGRKFVFESLKLTQMKFCGKNFAFCSWMVNHTPYAMAHTKW